MYELSETPTSKVGFTCLQGGMRNGPFYEADSCYYYGNTLQATLDTSALKNTPTGKQLHTFALDRHIVGLRNTVHL